MPAMLNHIHLGDCLEVMKAIPAGSVDMVLADLPYGTTRNAWDVVIDFEALWAEYLRVAKENAAIVLFGQGVFTARLILSQEALYRYSLVWDKGRVSGHLNAKKMPLRSHEDICVFYRKLPTYNPQFWEGRPQHARTVKADEKNANYGAFTRQAEAGGNTRKYPRSILAMPKPHPPVHPTQKGVELCEWLIKTYTNPGEVVLDNCIGSGTTAEAAINTGRQFIGIENDPHWHGYASERVGGMLASETQAKCGRCNDTGTVPIVAGINGECREIARSVCGKCEAYYRPA